MPFDGSSPGCPAQMASRHGASPPQPLQPRSSLDAEPIRLQASARRRRPAPPPPPPPLPRRTKDPFPAGPLRWQREARRQPLVTFRTRTAATATTAAAVASMVRGGLWGRPPVRRLLGERCCCCIASCRRARCTSSWPCWRSCRRIPLPPSPPLLVAKRMVVGEASAAEGPSALSVAAQRAGAAVWAAGSTLTRLPPPAQVCLPTQQHSGGLLLISRSLSVLVLQWLKLIDSARSSLSIRISCLTPATSRLQVAAHQSWTCLPMSYCLGPEAGCAP